MLITNSSGWANAIIFKYISVYSVSNTGPTAGANDSRIQDLTVEKGTIHTKRHSGEDPIKNG